MRVKFDDIDWLAWFGVAAITLIAVLAIVRGDKGCRCEMRSQEKGEPAKCAQTEQQTTPK